MLDYTLELNLLTPEQSDLRGVPQNTVTLTDEDLYNDALSIGAGLTKSDITSVMEAYKTVLAKRIAEGYNINTDLISLHLSIQGVFSSRDDTVDGVHRTVHLNIHPGALLRDAVKQIKTRKLDVTAPSIAITEVTDTKTGSLNDRLTVNQVVKITGVKIKIAGDDPTIGLYFVPNNRNPPIKVDPSTVVENNPKKILAMIPSLPSGKYQIRVITQFNGSGTFLKKPHIVTYEPLLTVG